MGASPTASRRSVSSPSEFPIRRDAFLGRKVELSTAHGAFVHGVRVVTVSGASGVGKTRFALEYATSRKGAARFGLRRTYCPLGPMDVDDEEAIARAVAYALDIPASGPSRAQQVARALSARGRILLVIDGVERATRHAHACVADWAKAAPDACFLVTAHAPLGVPGERVIALEPLPVPSQRRGDQSEAVELLLDRVTRIQSAFEPTPPERKTLGVLARDLEGVPLALEVAAHCVGVSGITVAYERLREIADQGKSPAGADGLRLGLDLSWEHLSPFERDVFARSAVFRGGFTLETLGALVPGYAEGTFPLPDVVDALRRRALFVPDGTSTLRFTLRPAVRAYADQRLLEGGAWADASERHAVWFAASAASWASEYERTGSADVFDEMRAERANVMAALSYLRALPEETEDTVRMALTLLSALHPLVVVDLAFEPYRTWLEEALAAAELVAVRPMLRGRALLHRRDLARLMETLDPTRHRDLDEAHAIARIERDEVLDGLAMLLLAREKDLAAHDALLAALPSFRRAGYPAIEAAAAETLGQLLWREGHFELAIERFRRAHEVHRSLGDGRGQGRVLAWLLHVSLELEAHAVETQTWLRQALTIHRAVPDAWSECLTKWARGLVQLDTGHARAGLVSFREALDLARSIGLQDEASDLRGFEGIALYEGGQSTAALQTLGDAARTLERLGRFAHAVRCRAYVAVSRVQLGQLDAAAEAFAEVDRHAARVHLPALQSAIGILRAQLDLALATEAASQGAAAQAEELRSHARARIEATLPFDRDVRALALRSVDVRLALRAFERVPGGRKLLEAVRHEHVGEGPDAVMATTLEVAPDAAWFALPGGRVVHCTRVPTLARLLEVLAVAREQTPGTYVTREQLMDAAWREDPPTTAASAKNRLHVAIARLRGLGLHGLVVGGAEGYRLDPSVPFRRATV